jgi:uncharacterized tellurite resistance protein B-like protein
MRNLFVYVVLFVVSIALIGLLMSRGRRGRPRPRSRSRRAAGRGRGSRRTPGSSTLAREPEREPEPAAPSPQFVASAALLHLAVIVCTADEAVSVTERRLLEEHVARAAGISEDERGQLRDQLATLLASKPNFRGVKKRLDGLDTRQRAVIADLLIGVAGADGQVAPDEIRLLGRIYPMLGLPAEEVYSRVHALSAGAAAGEPQVPIAAGVTAAAGGSAAPPAIRLNMTAVQAKLAQSAEVSALLGDIFSEQEPDTPPARVMPTPAAPAGAMAAVHGMLLTRLVARAAWTRQEFEAMAAELQLLPDGAIDALNEAAFERAGAPVLEGDDPMHVDLAIAKELLA